MGTGLILAVLIFVNPLLQAQTPVDVTDFSELAGWREILFQEGDLPSTFEPVVADDATSILRVRTEGGSSMIVLEEPVDIDETAILRWRWKLVDGLDSADLSRRRFEDAAIRVVVSFRNPLEDLPWWLRIWAAHQEGRHGEVPPTSAIMYAWAARPHEDASFPIPYTDRIQIVPVEDRPPSERWQTVEVDVRADHERLFGEPPPETAFIGIMSDSDNTGESGEALVDYIRLDRR
ncbi:MAG: DUF3047 domain-containing protein [Alkalispirochaeta sp.]